MQVQLSNTVGNLLPEQRLAEVLALFEAFQGGDIHAENALHKRLESLQIRGDFDGRRYVGYDYEHQGWIEVQL